MIRKIFVAAVGITQVAIGFFSFILIYILHYNIFNFQTMFNISIENLPLYVLLLFFGLFSMLSGFSFIQEWQSYT